MTGRCTAIGIKRSTMNHGLAHSSRQPHLPSFLRLKILFSPSCILGARSSKFDPQGENPENLCEICGGTGENKCSYESDKEPYAGHTGALKCLTDGKGDVAFFKHGTVKDNVSDYEYLCPDGTRKGNLPQRHYC